jgi:hypothetical protein
LQTALSELAARSWRHPLTGLECFGASTTGLLIGLPDDLADSIARVTQCHHEQPGSAVFSGRPGSRALSVRTKRLTELYRWGELVPFDQVLVDALGSAPELELILDPAAVLLEAERACFGG